MSVQLVAPSPLPYWTIAPEHRLDRVVFFFRSLPSRDLVARFGLPGSSPVEWLIERLATEPQRGVLAARSGDSIVGVTDHTHAGCAIEFGVVVDPTHRRRGIGSALIAALREHAERCREPLLAHTNRANFAAISCLLRNGFDVHGGTFDALRFVRPTNERECVR
jgi:GNAT superfamily N-acetyltransferase